MPPVEQSLPERAPYNRLAITRERPDSLRISGWLDLREPVMLSTPDTHGRYFVLWLRDPWDTVFATVGARTTGTAAQAFVLLGPGLQDAEVASGLTPIIAPTRLVEVRGCIEAVRDVPELGAGFTVIPQADVPSLPRPARAPGWQIVSDDPIVDELPLVTETDETGAPLDGRSQYTLRFAPDGAPPIDGFWSVTTFDREQPARGLHSLGDLYGLRTDADGSLPVLLQHDPPARRYRSNWLPVPAGRFRAELRLYWPRAEALDSRWKPPPITRRALRPSLVRPMQEEAR